VRVEGHGTISRLLPAARHPFRRPKPLIGPPNVPMNDTMRRAAALVLASALGVLSLPVIASAQEPTTTTTSAPPETTTTTLLPDLSSTTTSTTSPNSPEDPVADESAPEDSVPLSPSTVPPRPGGVAVNAAAASGVLRRELRVARAEALQTQAAFDAAKARVDLLTARLAELDATVSKLTVDQQTSVRRLDSAKRLFEERAANALVRGGAAELESFLAATNPVELGARSTLMGSVLDADQSSVDEYLAAKKELDGHLAATANDLAATRTELDGATLALADADKLNQESHFNLSVFAAGSAIVIRGFVFPVDDPHSFGNSFGAPRMVGTQYQHSHQGTDILAPPGTRLFACERGFITRMGADVLGGIKIWVKGESGTYYYYAHLTGYAEGMTEGKVVEAGDVIGFVGTTGNARGGPAHLHYEIHPDGGPAVNPYPLLKVVDDLRKRQAKPK
jgi:murein DD-endopeptidase MepM/ murein hydrolase activator NlpD